MAKVTVVLDTETNKLSVDMDGKELTNVDSVSVYRYDEGALSFNMCERVKEGEVSQYTSYSWTTPRYGYSESSIKIDKSSGNLQKSIANLLKK